jgi:hypothetical protein
MTTSSTTIEPITSDPVIIESSDSQEATEITVEAKTPRPAERDGGCPESLSEDEALSEYSDDERVRERPTRSMGNHRDFSPPGRIPKFVSVVKEVPGLADTAALNKLIDMPDTCADTANNYLVYIANNPIHAADLEKVSWILRIGIQDTWVQKPVNFLTSNGYKFDLPPANSRRRHVGYDCYDDRYDDGFDGPMNRRNTPIARLGTALRVFRTDEEKYGTEKVKFIIAVEGKSNAGLKLVISHSRQAAAVDIFHEILNGYGIQFVGAVLKDVVIPIEAPNKEPAVKFQCVGSLKDAEEVGQGVVGVIC